MVQTGELSISIEGLNGVLPGGDGAAPWGGVASGRGDEVAPGAPLRRGGGCGSPRDTPLLLLLPPCTLLGEGLIKFNLKISENSVNFRENFSEIFFFL